MKPMQTIVEVTSDNKEQAIEALNILIKRIKSKHYDSVIFENIVVTLEESGWETETTLANLKNKKIGA